MDKLDHRQLTLIKRAAEDAIHACNRHYGPFVDVVAHPLNIIALVEMAQSRQAEVAQANQEWQKHIDEKEKHAHNLYYENANLQMLVEEKDKRVEELESALKKINENLDLHDCESCWQHYFEIEKVLPGLQGGEHEQTHTLRV